MQKYSDVVLDKNGKGIAGATITVTTYPNATPATIYAADGGPAVTSVTTDNAGRFAFYAANGHYSITVSGQGITPYTYNDVTLFDQNDLKAEFAAGTGSSLVTFTQEGIGAVPRSQQDRGREWVSVKDFGALCDGATDDHVAVQKAIDYCLSFARAKALRVPGRCLIGASLIINRLVDTTLSEFRIIGEGPGAGFHTTGGVVIFDSTLPGTTAPQSEAVTFENLHFETSSIFNASYVISGKFLRIKAINCNFRLIRFVNSPIYVQTLHFIECNIRNNPASFIKSDGLYDVVFNSGIVENGNTLVENISTAMGTNSLKLIGGIVIEGIQTSIVRANGVSGFVLQAHLESNFSPEFNFFVGGPANHSILVSGSYIYNPTGPTFYYGPTDCVVSEGNLCSPNKLHSNVSAVTSLVSIGDQCSGGISDAAIYSTVNGVYRAGGAESTWTHSSNHITKDTNGMFGFGRAPVGVVRAAFQGADQSSSGFANMNYDSAGNVIFGAQNDRQLLAPAIAAATGVALVLDGSGYIKKTTKPTISGSRGGNAALASLLSGLAGMGVITDSTTT